MSWYQQYWGAVGAASDARKALKAARRLRMTKAEKQAVEYYIGTGGPKAADDALRRLVKRHGAKK
jgi:hypothetical protein